MLERYTLPEMAYIWSEDYKIKTWQQIESASAKAMESVGLIPKGLSQLIDSANQPTVAAIKEHEKITHHEFLAFLSALKDNIKGHKDERLIEYMHYGMTSSDALDTGLSLQIKASIAFLKKELIDLNQKVKNKALLTKDWLSVGRSHGVHAELTSFGLKFALLYTEISRHLDRLMLAEKEVCVAMVSGPVGNFSILSPDIQDLIANYLELRGDLLSTQVIARDRHAFLIQVIGGIAMTIERFAVEIRHLQRTEVREVCEPFREGQKGSSAMPHKKNPILSENLTGLSRLLKSFVIPAMDNVVLWHERDMSHSSVERYIFPSAFGLLHFALKRLNLVIEGLILNKDQIDLNAQYMGGIVFSQRVMLAFVNKGFARDEAYKIIQQLSLKALNENGSFKDNILNNQFLQDKFGSELIKIVQEAMNPEDSLRSVDLIYKRIFG